jgi:hypothetical protein
MWRGTSLLRSENGMRLVESRENVKNDDLLNTYTGAQPVDNYV